MADNSSNELVLRISIEEANIILEGLGELAFKKSYALVNKIQYAASVQLGSNGQTAESPVEDNPSTDEN
ncbi:MAG: hypothetical protein JNL02_09605 [Saprospiraceae bacterium]|nr:hypothetical protein [Saprospiraceae bacterium]